MKQGPDLPLALSKHQIISLFCLRGDLAEQSLKPERQGACCHSAICLLRGLGSVPRFTCMQKKKEKNTYLRGLS